MWRRLNMAAWLVLATAVTGFAYETYSDAFKASQEAYNKKEYSVAVTAGTEAVTLAQNAMEKALALYQVGWAQNRAGQSAEALAAWDQMLAIADVPVNIAASARKAKAEVYLSSKQYAEAEKEARKLLEMTDIRNDLKFSGFQFLCRSLLSQNKSAEARTEIEKFLAADESKPVEKAQATLFMGESWQAEKDYEKAREEWKKVSTLPRQGGLAINLISQSLNLIAASYLLENKPAEAKAAYIELVNTDKLDSRVKAHALVEIGRIHAAANEATDARKAFQAALQHKLILPEDRAGAEKGLKDLEPPAAPVAPAEPQQQP